MNPRLMSPPNIRHVVCLMDDEQHAAIIKFMQHERNVAEETITLFHQQISRQSEGLREQGAQQSDILSHRQANATVGRPTLVHRPESSVFDLNKLATARKRRLAKMFVEFDDAVDACRVVAYATVKLSMSDLGGRAKSGP